MEQPVEHAPSPIRIGLIGAGPWATSVHAPGIVAHQDTELVAVWARRADAAAEVAGPYGARVAASAAELIESVDAVAFAVPPGVQAPLAIQAAKAGKHLVLEKPIGANVTQAQELVDAVTEANVAGLVMITRHFDPNVRAWLAKVRQTGGWLAGAATWLTGALLAGQYANSAWRHERGGLVDIGPHLFDLLDSALGPVETVLSAHRAEPDLWHVTLGHAGGVTSTAAMSLRFPVPTAVVDLSIYGPAGTSSAPAAGVSVGECYAVLLDEFVAMVREGRVEHDCDVRRGLYLQRLIEQAETLAAHA